jgi:hypothetical protein
MVFLRETIKKRVWHVPPQKGSAYFPSGDIHEDETILLR